MRKVLLLISILILNSCQNNKTESSENDEVLEEVIVSDSVLEFQKKLEEMAKKEEDSINKLNVVKLESLKKKFTYKYDEFKEVGFYSHKRWGNYLPNRKTLTSGVNSQGYVWLKSNYYDDDWLFHESISVLIDGAKFDSDIVPSYSDDNHTDNDGGDIWEVVNYKDSYLIDNIAANVDKTIKVRFNGSKYYDDIVLSNADKQAIKDCYQLGNLIKNKK